jgi:hypothetical protein
MFWKNENWNSLGDNIIIEELWIGLNDKANARTYVWESGTEVTVTNWVSSHSSGNCVEITTNGKWNNADCSKSLPF